MATKYPNDIDNTTSLPYISNGTSPMVADDVNRLRDAVVAVQTELGSDPSGTFTSVRDRIAANEQSISDYAQSEFLVLSHDGFVSHERRFAPSSNFFTVDGGAGADYSIDLANVVGIGTLSPAADYSLTLDGNATDRRGGLVLRQSGTNTFLIGNISASNTQDIQLLNPRAGYVALGTSGLERMRIEADGRVGVNTLTPAAQLHIKGLAEVARIESTSPRGSGNNYLSFYDPTGPKGYIGYGVNDDLGIGNSLSAAVRFLTSDLERMRITSGGNVGIGTESPVVELDVDGAINIQNDNNLTWGGTYSAGNPTIAGASAGSASRIGFYPQGAVSGETVTFTADRRVGIGTTAPTAKLDIASDIDAWATFGASSTAASFMSFRRAGSSSNVGYIGTDDGGIIGVPGGPGINFGVRAESDLILMSGSAERARFTSGGNLGIGTSSPLVPLDVSVAGRGVGYFRTTDTGTSNQVAFANGSNFAAGVVGTISGTGAIGGDIFGLGYSSNPPTIDFTSVLSWTSLGTVGINTNPDPGTKLHVKGVNEILRLDTTTARGGGRNYLAFHDPSGRKGYVGYGSTSDDQLDISNDIAPIVFLTTGLERARIDASGNVGVGTSSPSAKLDVAGPVTFNGLPHNESTTSDGFIYFSPQKYIEAGASAVGTLFSSFNSGGTFTCAPAGTTVGGVTIPASDEIPFSKVVLHTSYTEMRSDFIPVQAGETVYGEIWASRPLGAGGGDGAFYFGICRFDKDKNPIAANSGIEYFPGTGISIPTDGVWRRYGGELALPTTHTPFGGSDGGAVRYIKVIIIVNYNAGTVPTAWGGALVRRATTLRDNGPNISDYTVFSFSRNDYPDRTLSDVLNSKFPVQARKKGMLINVIETVDNVSFMVSWSGLKWVLDKYSVDLANLAIDPTVEGIGTPGPKTLRSNILGPVASTASGSVTLVSGSVYNLSGFSSLPDIFSFISPNDKNGDGADISNEGWLVIIRNIGTAGNHTPYKAFLVSSRVDASTLQCVIFPSGSWTSDINNGSLKFDVFPLGPGSILRTWTYGLQTGQVVNIADSQYKILSGGDESSLTITGLFNKTDSSSTFNTTIISAGTSGAGDIRPSFSSSGGVAKSYNRFIRMPSGSVTLGTGTTPDPDQVTGQAIPAIPSEGLRIYLYGYYPGIGDGKLLSPPALRYSVRAPGNSQGFGGTFPSTAPSPLVGVPGDYICVGTALISMQKGSDIPTVFGGMRILNDMTGGPLWFYFRDPENENLDGGSSVQKDLKDERNEIPTTTGTVTAGSTTTTLPDSSKSWITNTFKGATVTITSGALSGQTRTIASNTNNTLTVSPAWASAPATGVSYIIVNAQEEIMHGILITDNMFSRYADVVEQITIINNGSTSSAFDIYRAGIKSGTVNVGAGQQSVFFNSYKDRLTSGGEASRGQNVIKIVRSSNHEPYQYIIKSWIRGLRFNY